MKEQVARCKRCEELCPREALFAGWCDVCRDDERAHAQDFYALLKDEKERYERGWWL